MAEGAASAPEAVKGSEWKGGTLLYAGGTDWSLLGRTGGKVKKDPKSEELFPNHPQATRLKSLASVRILFVAAGPAAVHCLAGDVDGNLFTWGRNEKGQLGHGDLINRHTPRIVEGLRGHFVAGAAAGRHHTLVYTKAGQAWAWGLNQQGQLGLGSIRKAATKGYEDVHTSPAKVNLEAVTKVAAGIDFSMWLAGGKLHSAGSPQYGQLGDGSDHAYNAKDSSIAIVYDPIPTPKVVPAFKEATITNVACGHNHTVAVDDAGNCYTWGFGGYGRLGHRLQKDEFAPRRIEEFKNRLSVRPNAVLAAGSTSTFCTVTVGGQSEVLYSWGKLKVSGDNIMFPMVEQNLTGWNVRSIACGPQHFAIAADQSVITWGFATNGELAYGPHGKKSSANPAKVDDLEGATTHQVAAGVGFTLFLVDPDWAKLPSLPEFQSTAPEEASASGADDEGGAGGKRKGGAGPPAKKAKK